MDFESQFILCQGFHVSYSINKVEKQDMQGIQSFLSIELKKGEKQFFLQEDSFIHQDPQLLPVIVVFLVFLVAAVFFEVELDPFVPLSA